MQQIGILDPEGKNNNPLNDQPYSDDYKALGKIWSKFPAYETAKQIIQDIKNYNVILIVAQTGSGKTVLVPKYLTHALGYKKKIAITLPKQMIAKSAAEFAAKTLDVKVGEHVGYQYKNSPRSAKSDQTQLLYATDGTIVARLLNDPLLSDFDGVIIDEAHERKVQIDFLLYLLRDTIKLRPEFKLIIMSATIDHNIFASYFSDKMYKFKHMNISGRTNYPIKSIFLQEDPTYKESLNRGYDIVKKLLQSTNRDILFFVTSSNEAFELCKRLAQDNKMNIAKRNNTFCVELYSGMDPTKQQLAQDKVLFKTFDPNKKFVQKLVISTNVAESSLTVDGIKYVIDSGYELSSSYDPDLRARRLDRKLTSQAQAKQRMGRSGRTEPGICYHLYTENTFKNIMKKFPEPDIRVSDLTGDCLRLLNLKKIQSVENLLHVFTSFIEPPRENYITTSVNALVQIGAIEQNKISELGKIIVKLDTSDVMFTYALLVSKLYKCSHEVAKIGSLIQVSKYNISALFKKIKKQQNNKKLQQKYNKIIHKYAHPSGDHLSLLRIYEKYDAQTKKHKDNPNKVKQWCQDNFLKYNLLKKAKKNKRKIINKLRDHDIVKIIKQHDDISKQDLSTKILICLLLGYRTQTAVRSKHNAYRTRYSQDTVIKIGKSSFMKANPKNIFYGELFVNNNRANLNIVSKISPNIIKLLS